MKEDLTAEFRIIQELANELNNFKVTVLTVKGDSYLIGVPTSCAEGDRD